jgi:hypothetical protein
VLGILGALFVVLKMVKSAQGRSTGANAGKPGAAPVTAGQTRTAEQVAADEESEEAVADLFKLRERVNSSVSHNPVTATRVLREWLRDGGMN